MYTMRVTRHVLFIALRRYIHYTFLSIVHSKRYIYIFPELTLSDLLLSQ